MKVLVLGDSTLSQLADFTPRDNVQVVRMAEIPEALPLIEKMDFDIVVLGGLNGNTESACRSVKKVSHTPVVLAVNPAQADWKQMESLGMDGFISDQIGQVQLLARLRALVVRDRAAKRGNNPSLSLRVKRSNSGRVDAKPQYTINWRSWAKRNTVTQTICGFLATVIGFLIFIYLAPGYDLLLVRSQSMEPAINMGDMVVTGPVNGLLNGKLAPRKIITFQMGQKLVTHRLIEIKGETLITKGDALKHPDPDPVDISYVKGVVMFRIPYIGYVDSFVHSKKGWFITIIIPAFVLVLFIVKDIVKEAFK